MPQSPLLWGADPAKIASWRATDRVTRQADAVVQTVPARTEIVAVLPYYRRTSFESMRARDRGTQRATLPAHQARLWLDARHDGPVLLIHDPGQQIAYDARLDGDTLEVRVPTDAQVFVLAEDLGETEESGHRLLRVDLGEPRKAGRELLLHDGKKAQFQRSH